MCPHRVRLLSHGGTFLLAVSLATGSGVHARALSSRAPIAPASGPPSGGVFDAMAVTRPAAYRLQLEPLGAAAFDYFGTSVAGAGDINGDGFADFIVGAYQRDGSGTRPGRAYVYYGGPTADTGADGLLAGAASGDEYGFSVAGAGDMNGDGYDDLIVGAYQNDARGANIGRAYVYYGGSSFDSPDLTLTGELAGDGFGVSVASAGDMNGDGYAEVIVGGYRNDAAGSNAGRAYVYYGGPTPDATADLVLTGAEAVDEFGRRVAGAGDVNGDGYDDVIVGAHFNDGGGPSSSDNRGRAYLYLGGPAADNTADFVLTGEAAGDQFGIWVAGAGDVNRDGFDDLIVGADENDFAGNQAGRAYLYFGGPTPNTTADLVLTGGAAGDRFGRVAAAGDVNGDGYADLLVGASAAAGAAGRAYVFYGGATPDAVADVVLRGEESGDQFAIGVAGAGDVNGDGFADVVVGAFASDATGTDAGRAYLYDFKRYFVGAPNGGETWTAGETVTISWLGAEPANLWLSVNGGASYQLLAHAIGAADTNRRSVQVPDLPTNSALIRVAPLNARVRGRDVSDAVFTIRRTVSMGGQPSQADVGSLAAWPLPYRGGNLTIAFAVGGAPHAEPNEVEVGLYDLTGRRVWGVARGTYGAGRHRVTWDGRNASGQRLADGLYFLRASCGGPVSCIRIAVMH